VEKCKVLLWPELSSKEQKVELKIRRQKLLVMLGNEKRREEESHRATPRFSGELGNGSQRTPFVLPARGHQNQFCLKLSAGS
jgi:hypothetical protein